MKKSKIAIIFFLFSVTFVLVLGIGLYQLIEFRGTPGSPGLHGTEVEVFYDVQKHKSPYSIFKELSKAGVVSNPRLFYWYGRLTNRTSKIKMGDYRFTTSMLPDQVYSILTSGISYGIPFTVPEGYTFYQIADLLEQVRPGSRDRFIRVCTNPEFLQNLASSFAIAGLQSATSVEGYLFPDTYRLERRMTEEELIYQMLKKYRAVVNPEVLQRATEMQFNEHQMLTLASIVEKETGAPQERPLIAAVFETRLKKGMRLQTDPTVMYGKKDYTYSGNITRKDLETATPYNTYVIPALPPGPIGNPGKGAILAVLNPAKSSYLYFVSHNDGTHEFSETYEAHKKAVSKFQLDPKAREGKSWRDLKASH